MSDAVVVVVLAAAIAISARAHTSPVIDFPRMPKNLQLFVQKERNGLGTREREITTTTRELC